MTSKITVGTEVYFKRDIEGHGIVRKIAKVFNTWTRTYDIVYLVQTDHPEAYFIDAINCDGLSLDADEVDTDE